MAARVTTVAELTGSLPVGVVRDVVGDPNVDVTDVVLDSRAVTPGALFACLVGEHADGHTFASAAVDAGARSLLVDHVLDLAVPQLVADDTRAALGPLAATFNGNPSHDLTAVGITGTNGKTTTAHMLAHVLSSGGLEVGVHGTLSGVRTTPEAPELQARLAAERDAGKQAVVMEVSSHALALHRVDGTRFAAAVFTNLGRDHLDLHGSVEEYFRAKARLFMPDLSRLGVVNVDDTYGRLLHDAATIDMVPYSLDDATDVDVGVDQHRFRWRGHQVVVALGGSFNVMNTLAALTAATVLGLDAGTAAASLAELPPVPGRFEVVSGPEQNFTVVVDYAHTPDGLERLLESARSVAGSGRVLVVFGCGGDRDREKRPMMGAVAAEGADRVFVTSDNPRDEDPGAIIAAVVAGIAPGYGDRVAIEPDRRAAIATALGEARSGDVVVIAGKGHEATQTIGATALPFDDRVVARDLLEEMS